MGLEDKAKRIMREEEDAMRLEHEKNLSVFVESVKKAETVARKSEIMVQIENLVELIKRDPKNKYYRVELDQSINPSYRNLYYNTGIVTGKRGLFGGWKKKIEYASNGRSYKPEDTKAFYTIIRWGSNDYDNNSNYVEFVIDKKDNLIILPGKDEIPELHGRKGFILAEDKFKDKDFLEECVAWAFIHPMRNEAVYY